MSREQSAADPLGPLADEFVRRYRNGERPALSEYIEREPHLADLIREVFPVLVMMEEAGTGVVADVSATVQHQRPIVPAAKSLPERIGGYRIEREIGRGGMGVVYEAEQIALGRHVALKVLPLETAQDALGVERFRREARVAAGLHHTNIVPVFEVGDDKGTCFYAMQYIHGQALDQVLDELRLLRDQASSDGAPPESLRHSSQISQQVAHSLMGGFQAPRAKESPSVTPQHSPPGDGCLTQRHNADTTKTGKPLLLPGQKASAHTDAKRMTYYHSVARVGIQVAEALDYAHREGVLHRDIKPANLLLDTHGRVWITDFGLAIAGEGSLTRQGDIIGTLRYMAPERLRGHADVRSDVYSLGLALYEMLLLRPAFDSPDRIALVHQITREAPSALRRHDPSIPRDLETIINKTIEKDSTRRYASARELAADLQRFLDHKPIQARPTPVLEHGWRWCQRNPVIAALMMCVLLVALAGLAGIILQWRQAVNNLKLANQNALIAQKNASEAKKQNAKAKRQKTEAEIQRQKTEDANKELRATLNRLSRISYIAHMNLAQHAWYAGGTARVAEILQQHKPKAGEKELRDFEWYYFRRLLRANPFTLTGRGRPTACFAFSPDGQRVACVGPAPTLRILKLQTGKTQYTWMPHGSAFTMSAAFSPDGKYLATGGIDRTIKIWSAQRFKEIRTLKGYTQAVNELKFSRDGSRLAGLSGDARNTGELIMWNVKTLTSMYVRPGFLGGVGAVSFSGDGKRLAVAFDKNSVKILDTETGQERKHLEVTKSTLRALALHPDGKQLAVAAWDSSVYVYDVDSRRTLHKLIWHWNPVSAVAYSPDGKFLATGGKRIQIWDAATGDHLHCHRGHQQTIWDLRFAPDSKLLASTSAGESVRIWDANQGGEPFTVRAHKSALLSTAFSPDGRYFATSGQDKHVRLWDARSGKLVHDFANTVQSANCVTFSPDSKYLACASLSNEVKIWNVKTHQLAGPPLKTRGAVEWVAFNHDGSRLAAVNWQGMLDVWHMRDGRGVRAFSIRAHRDKILSVKFSPNGLYVVTASADHSLKLWSVQNGRLARSFQGHTGAVNDAAFSPDGKTIASAADDQTIKLWNVATSIEEHTMRGHAAAVVRVVFCPDGKRLATASRDKAIKLWDVHSRLETLTLVPDRARPSALSFNGDGTRLASAWNDGKVRIWEAPR